MLRSRHGRCTTIASRTSSHAGNLTWDELVSAAERHSFRGLPLSEISNDSRTIRAGAIFVAHRGRQADGHTFIADALAAGARLVVAERPVRCPVPVSVVPDGRRALSALAANWFGHPARRMHMVGVTGTNGKTTTVHLVASILEAAGLSPCTVGTLGFRRGGHTTALLPWTTPPPVQLHSGLAEQLEAGADACILEVSAQGVSEARVADCSFEVAAITNLTRDHREYYDSAQEYLEAKLGLFRLLETSARPAVAVLNRALPQLDLFRGACGVPVVEYGDGAEVRALAVRPEGLEGTQLVLHLPGRPRGVPLRLHLPGPHNVENALCAAAIGTAMGLHAEEIAAGLQQVHDVPGRLQDVSRGGVRVVVDYAHNPAGLRALLRLLRTSAVGRLVVVMGARGRRDQGKRSLMGGVAASFADLVVLTSDRPAGEDPEEAAAPMRAAIADCGVPVRFVPDRLQALELALDGRVPGDVVVAVGKGEEPWEGDSAEPGWDDVSALRALQAEGGLAEATVQRARLFPRSVGA